MTHETPPSTPVAKGAVRPYRADRDPVVRALRMARDAVRATAQGEVSWLRETASDQRDHVRIVGVEDAYRSALATLDVHIESAKAKGRKAAANALPDPSLSSPTAQSAAADTGRAADAPGPAGPSRPAGRRR